MRVRGVRVARPRDRHRVRLVGDVGDVELRLVRAEADLLPPPVLVGAAVDDALRVVGVAPGARRVPVAPGEGRLERVAHIHDVQPTPARRAAAVRADDVDVPGGGVRDDVVGAEDLAVRRLGLELDHLGPDVEEAGQVEDLHPVGARPVGDDEGVVADHLDVAPDRGARTRRARQVAHQSGRSGVGHLQEGGAVPAGHEGEAPTALRVLPPPDVVHPNAALPTEGGDGEVRDELHVLAGKLGHRSGLAAVARSQALTEAEDLPLEEPGGGPRRSVAGDGEGAALPEIARRHADHRAIGVGGHGVAEGEGPGVPRRLVRVDADGRVPAAHPVREVAVDPSVPPRRAGRTDPEFTVGRSEGEAELRAVPHVEGPHDPVDQPVPGLVLGVEDDDRRTRGAHDGVVPHPEHRAAESGSFPQALGHLQRDRGRPPGLLPRRHEGAARPLAAGRGADQESVSVPRHRGAEARGRGIARRQRLIGDPLGPGA